MTKTLRDEFAMDALKIAAARAWDHLGDDEKIISAWAAMAYAVADAMMAERLKGQAEKQAEDGWIPWAGGGSPVAPLQKVTVRLRDGSEWSHFANVYEWDHRDTPTDITAYRVTP